MLRWNTFLQGGLGSERQRELQRRAPCAALCAPCSAAWPPPMSVPKGAFPVLWLWGSLVGGAWLSGWDREDWTRPRGLELGPPLTTRPLGGPLCKGDMVVSEE